MKKMDEMRKIVTDSKLANYLIRWVTNIKAVCLSIYTIPQSFDGKFIENYAGVRRFVLLFMMFYCYRVIEVSISMYKANNSLDGNWTDLVKVFLGVLAVIVGFYYATDKRGGGDTTQDDGSGEENT